MASPARKLTPITPDIPAEWLPSKQPPLLTTKSMYAERFLQLNKDRDGLLALAWAMEQEGRDELQSRWLAKAYVFLCDFIPQGLTGPFSHISGNDTMEALLSHKETTATRHKMAKQAYREFKELEKWMGSWKTWEEAARNAREEAEAQRAVTKKKVAWKAPGLLSPEGMLAILVIAHPNNSKFKDKIGRLQVQWMMTQDRDTLHVRDGFWKGITLANLFSVFSPSEAREAEVPLLADYDSLLGADFLSCRKNIRPFLPQWAASLSFADKAEDLITVESDTEESVSGVHAEPDNSHCGSVSVDDQDTIDVRDPGEAAGDSSHAPSTSGERRQPSVHTEATDDGPQAPEKSGEGGNASPHTSGGGAEAGDAQRLRSTPPEVSPAEVSSIRGLLSQETGLKTAELEAWLMQRLAGDDTVLKLWCEHWDRRADQTANLWQQITARELFAQSLRWLYNLHTSGSPLVKAYMLMSVADHQVTEPPKETFKQSSELLGAFPEYTAFREATEQVGRHAFQVSGETGRDLVASIMMAETCHFYSLSMGSHFSQVKKCIVLEHLWACVVLQNLPESSSPAALHWRSRYDLLLRAETIAALQLTGWQMLTLLFPGAVCDHVVTKCQAWHFWHVIASDAPSSSGYPRLCKAGPVATTAVATSSICKRYPALQKLLGDLVIQDASLADLLADVSSTSFLVSRHAHTPTPPAVLPVAELTPPAMTPTAMTPMTPAAAPVNMRYLAARALGDDSCSAAPPRPVTHVRSSAIPAAEKPTPTLARLSFAGKTFGLSKRSASPDRKDPKKPRIDWAEQLQGLINTSQVLKDEVASLKTEVSSMSNKIDKIPQQLTDQTNKLKEHVGGVAQTEIKTAHDKLRSDLDPQLSSCISTNTAVSSTLERFAQADVEHAVKSGIAELKESKAAMNSTEQSLKAELLRVQGLVDALRNPPRQPLRLGEDGFLRQECLAPPGWDQARYEGELERAAWSYIFELGNPDGGVGEDGVAYERTFARFPNLDARGFSIALQHIHMRVYHHAFHQDEQEVDNEVDHVE